MLDEAAIDQDLHKARTKGKSVIAAALAGRSSYFESYDFEEGEYPSSQRSYMSETPVQMYQGEPLQAPTIPMDEDNPFPMLDGPVDYG